MKQMLHVLEELPSPFLCQMSAATSPVHATCHCNAGTAPHCKTHSSCCHWQCSQQRQVTHCAASPAASAAAAARRGSSSSLSCTSRPSLSRMLPQPACSATGATCSTEAGAAETSQMATRVSKSTRQSVLWVKQHRQKQLACRAQPLQGIICHAQHL
jgi:hypothetical protein